MSQPAFAMPAYEAAIQEGVLKFRAGDYEQSKAAFVRAIEMEPKRSEAYAELMTACEQSADVDGLIAAIVRWLSVFPYDPKATQELVNICLNNRRYDPAIDQMKMLLKQEPNNASMLNVICLLFMEAKRYHDGLDYFERAFNLHPQQSPQVIKAFAWVLYQSGHFARALEMAKRAYADLTQDEEMHVLMASCYAALSDYDHYLGVYQQAMEHLPDNPTLRYSLGLIKMMHSDMKEGFDEYESRWGSSYCTMRHFDVPRWQGEPLAGKRLMIWAEQGVGDVTLFATLLPWLAQQNAQRIVAGAEKKMVALMARSFPQFEWMDYDAQAFADSAKASDFHAPMGDLMRYGLKHYTPAQHAPIYVPDVELKAMLRARYEAAAKARGAKKIIGISWHTKNDLNNVLRNIVLRDWAPLFALNEVQFVSLQYGDHASEIAEVEAEFPGALLVDDQVDAFASTDAAIAQVAAMDEVISIQNATAHFGGGVGVPTHLLLSAASDWRWGIQRSDSVWYKSVTVYRQREALIWHPLMRKLAKQIKDNIS